MLMKMRGEARELKTGNKIQFGFSIILKFTNLTQFYHQKISKIEVNGLIRNIRKELQLIQR